MYDLYGEYRKPARTPEWVDTLEDSKRDSQNDAVEAPYIPFSHLGLSTGEDMPHKIAKGDLPAEKAKIKTKGVPQAASEGQDTENTYFNGTVEKE